MPTVHQEEALQALHDLASGDCTPEKLRSFLEENYRGWGGSCSAPQGYNDLHHHVSLVMSRCLHDCLPGSVPGYEWMQQHGFAAVMAYIDHPNRKESEIKDLVMAAVENCEKVHEFGRPSSKNKGPSTVFKHKQTAS